MFDDLITEMLYREVERLREIHAEETWQISEYERENRELRRANFKHCNYIQDQQLELLRFVDEKDKLQKEVERLQYIIQRKDRAFIVAIKAAQSKAKTVTIVLKEIPSDGKQDIELP